MDTDTKRKCAELFRDKIGNYSFVCFHCGTQKDSAIDIITHVEFHYDDLTEATAVYPSDPVEIKPEHLGYESDEWHFEANPVGYDDIKSHDGQYIVEETIIDTKYDIKKPNVSGRKAKSKRYECNVCQKTYGNRKSWMDHERRMHADIEGKTFNCEICSASFDNLYRVREHMRKTHVPAVAVAAAKPPKWVDKNAVYKCEQCSKEYSLRHHYLLHKRQVHSCYDDTRSYNSDDDEAPTNKNLYQCGSCNKSFSEKRYWLAHERRVHTNPSKTYDCEICSASFAQLHTIRHHMQKKHSNQCQICSGSFEDLKDHTMNAHQTVDKVTNRLLFKCDLCPNLYTRTKQLKMHLIENHGKTDIMDKEPYRCDHCDKVFAVRFRLRNHVLLCHSLVKPFKCDECSAVFAFKHHLNAHKLIHGERKFICNVCGRAFKTSSNMLSHQRLHGRDPNAPKPFPCEVESCDRSFYYRHEREAHMRRHRDERPYQCYICGQSYHTRSKLTQHVRESHGTKRIKCKHCDRDFAPHRLKNHEQTHSDVRLFPCDICNNSFKSAKTLRQHKYIHDSEKRFKCNYCDLRFTQSAGRRGHERLKHLLI